MIELYRCEFGTNTPPCLKLPDQHMLHLKTFELGINSQNPGKQFVELMTHFI